MRILFLSNWFPYPQDNGSKLRIYGLLRGLAQKHPITLLSFSDQPEVDRNSSELNALCRDVQVVPRIPYHPRKVDAFAGLIHSEPRLIRETFSQEMARRIQVILSAQETDLVIASQLGTASYRAYFQDLPALFEEVEVGIYFEKFKSAASVGGKFRNGLTLVKHRHYMARLIRDYRACTVASDREKQLLSQITPTFEPIEVIPNFINLADYTVVNISSQPNRLIFTGSFRYFANHEAMDWFIREVYPIIQAEVPDVHLTITGDHANLPLPPSSNITLTGFVKDIRPLVASSWVSLVPLQIGGGTRLKILEAMALGTPVVSTSKGAEGLDASNGRHLLIGDTSQEFADQVLRLIKDQELRQEIVDRAREFVQAKYDWTVIMPRFESLVERISTV